MTEPDIPENIDRQTVLDLYQRHVNTSMARLGVLAMLPVEVHSEGNLIYNEHEQAYLDCGGYSVFLLGHRHPVVVEAVKAQLDRHPLSSRVMLNPELARASATLAGVCPAGLDYVWFTNSGAEAVEAGIKLARLNGKTRLIAAEGGFHGKTFGALSVTGKPQYQDPFRPLLPGVEFVSHGNAEALAAALAQTNGDACVILEPVQGENGVIVPPDGYLREVRRLCDEYDALLMLDEIQTGLGRLGAWWGADREDVVPDILLAGKVLSGGIVPVGAMVATAEVFAPFNKEPMLHSSTFAGNPLAMAAVTATVETIRREDIVGRSHRLGVVVLETLRTILAETCPSLVVEVRGLGLLIGVEFVDDHIATDFLFNLLQRKVVISSAMNTNRVARLTPSALLTESELQWLFEAVRESGLALQQRYVTKN